MDIQFEKRLFMEQYMKLKDESIIEKLSNTLKREVSKLKRLPITAQEREAIKSGQKDIKEGRIHTHEEVMDKMREKYPNLIK